MGYEFDIVVMRILLATLYKFNRVTDIFINYSCLIKALAVESSRSDDNNMDGRTSSPVL